MRKASLLGSLLAALPLFAAAADPLPAGLAQHPGSGNHRHPARGCTGALKIRRAAQKRRNVARNRRAHRG